MNGAGNCPIFIRCMNNFKQLEEILKLLLKYSSSQEGQIFLIKRREEIIANLSLIEQEYLQQIEKLNEE